MKLGLGCLCRPCWCRARYLELEYRTHLDKCAATSSTTSVQTRYTTRNWLVLDPVSVCHAGNTFGVGSWSGREDHAVFDSFFQTYFLRSWSFVWSFLRVQPNDSKGLHFRFRGRGAGAYCRFEKNARPTFWRNSEGKKVGKNGASLKL